jgi:hypothetical protein
MIFCSRVVARRQADGRADDSEDAHFTLVRGSHQYAPGMVAVGTDEVKASDGMSCGQIRLVGLKQLAAEFHGDQ